MRIKKILCFTLLIMIVLQNSLSVFANTPYPNYFMADQDGYWDLPTPAAYEPTKIIDFDETVNGKLNGPKDIFIKKDKEKGDTIYIADSANNRIVVLDSNWKFKYAISDGITDENDPAKLNDPQGVFVDENDTVLVADTGNKRVVEFTKYGSFRYQYKAPTDPLLGDNFADEYKPMKVVKDNRGYIYVINEGDGKGVLMLSSGGDFKSYFGANKVRLSFWESISRKIWSRDARKGNIVSLPYSFNNIMIGKDGYVYVTTTGLENQQVRKLNSAGSDVLFSKTKNFSDSNIARSLGYGVRQTFVDVTVDDDNNMTIIDRTACKIYQYDEIGRNLFAFGNRGNGNGQFKEPSSIDQDSSGRLYVLDRITSTITVFNQTKYAETIHNANKLYADAQYDKAFPEWDKVIDQDSYYIHALQAKGLTYMRKEQFSDAMREFYKAEDYVNYSKAFEQQRRIFIKDNFPIIATAVIVGSILLLVTATIRSKNKKKRGNLPPKKNFLTPIANFFKWITHVAFHPIDGFEGIRYENQGKFKDAFLIMFLYTATTIVAQYATSFIFRYGMPLDFVDWAYVIQMSLLPWIGASIVNYAVTTIVYGEGRFKDVLIGGAFCHVPFLLTTLPIALITNLLTEKERTFYDLANNIVLIWVVVLIYFCIKGVHGFHPVKAFFVTLGTAIGCAAVVLLFIIVYGMANQFIDFIIQFVKELVYLG